MESFSLENYLKWVLKFKTVEIFFKRKLNQDGNYLKECELKFSQKLLTKI